MKKVLGLVLGIILICGISGCSKAKSVSSENERELSESDTKLSEPTRTYISYKETTKSEEDSSLTEETAASTAESATTPSESAENQIQAASAGRSALHAVAVEVPVQSESRKIQEDVTPDSEGAVINGRDANYEYRVENGEAAILKYVGANNGEVRIPSEIGGCPVRHVAENAFNKMTMIKGIIVPDTVTSIGAYAFSNCMLMEYIVLPDSVISMGEGAVSHCNSLKSVNIPKGMSVMSKSLFENCSMLEKIEIPDNITEICDGALIDCDSLAEIKIGKNVSKIGMLAFANSEVSELVFPESTTYIGDFAVKRCGKLKSITVMNKNAEIGKDLCKHVNTGEITLFAVAGSSGQAYAEANGFAFAQISR